MPGQGPLSFPQPGQGPGGPGFGPLGPGQGQGPLGALFQREPPPRSGPPPPHSGPPGPPGPRPFMGNRQPFPPQQGPPFNSQHMPFGLQVRQRVSLNGSRGFRCARLHVSVFVCVCVRACVHACMLCQLIDAAELCEMHQKMFGFFSRWSPILSPSVSPHLLAFVLSIVLSWKKWHWSRKGNGISVVSQNRNEIQMDHTVLRIFHCLKSWH